MHFAKKTKGAWHSVRYLGRYLKRPPVSAVKTAALPRGCRCSSLP
ncbi:hypothetical protein QE197_24260 (plasmid) [Arsenophonus nasoniae]|nr:hypothetical protein [Arsenophonus nasoniae]WGM13640.1 hypothetical protein QE197_24260 [Arsenophonus nasoniae]